MYKAYINKDNPAAVEIRPVYTENKPDMITPTEEVVKVSKKCEYVPLYCGFDIETTNVISKERKAAYMYHAQMSCITENKGYVYTMRTWEQVIYLFDKISEAYRLNSKRHIIVWIANAGFEFQFIRHWITLDEGDFAFFAKEERQPLLFTYKGIEFREALSISGGSLAQLCKDYTVTQKLVGDLDYSIMRSCKDPVTGKDLDYCVNDVIPLAEWSKYIFDNFLRKGKRVPLTKTGILRNEVKEEFNSILEDNKEFYLKLIKDAYPNEDDYMLWGHYLFRGGYVHSNIIHTGMIINNVQMYDITSSYPARMNLSYYPGKFTPVKPDLKYCKDKCVIMDCTFENLRSTTTHSIESRSKCIELIGETVDNGRIDSAKKIRVMLTELDFDTYSKFYTWDSLKINYMLISDRQPLPPYLLNVLNRHYLKKAKLKEEGLNDTPEYAIEKSGVNAAFGLCVTRIELDKITYIDDWKTKKNEIVFENEVDKQILLPQWGIWIAAHARHELLSMVYEITKECGNIIVYNDTDSIKALPDPRADNIIKRYNENIAKQLKARGLTDKAFSDLGMFDNEGVALRFKTLGAKRYITEVFDKKKNKNVIKATISGLPKVAINNLIKQGKDPFEEFTEDGMLISEEDSGKIMHTYNDKAHGDFINGVWMEEKSSVALYDGTFNLKLDKDYYSMVIYNNRKEFSKL